MAERFEIHADIYIYQNDRLTKAELLCFLQKMRLLGKNKVMGKKRCPVTVKTPKWHGFCKKKPFLISIFWISPKKIIVLVSKRCIYWRNMTLVTWSITERPNFSFFINFLLFFLPYDPKPAPQQKLIVKTMKRKQKKRNCE